MYCIFYRWFLKFIITKINIVCIRQNDKIQIYFNKSYDFQGKKEKKYRKDTAAWMKNFVVTFTDSCAEIYFQNSFAKNCSHPHLTHCSHTLSLFLSWEIMFLIYLRTSPSLPRLSSPISYHFSEAPGFALQNMKVQHIARKFKRYLGSNIVMFFKKKLQGFIKILHGIW